MLAQHPTRDRVAVHSVLRRYPFTVSYLAVLAATGLLTMVVMSRTDADDMLRGVSTNLDNLTHRPLVAIIGSGIVVDNGSDILSLAFFVGLGLLVGLPMLERRCGSLRTFGVFATGHIGGTALVAVVELYGLHHGLLPDSIRSDFDYGISYGAMAVLGAMACQLPGWYRLLAAVLLASWPFVGADWTSLPDLGALGHASSAVLGVCCGAVIFARQRGAPQPAV